MREKKIGLEECQVGHILSKDVIDLESNEVLLSAGHIIIEHNIKRLSRFLHTSIYICR